MELPAGRVLFGLVLDASAFEFILSQIPPFDWLSSSLSDLPSTLSLRTKCGVEDRVVTVRLRSLSLSKVEGSEVEPPEAGKEMPMLFLCLLSSLKFKKP